MTFCGHMSFNCNRFFNPIIPNFTLWGNFGFCMPPVFTNYFGLGGGYSLPPTDFFSFTSPSLNLNNPSYDTYSSRNDFALTDRFDFSSHKNETVNKPYYTTYTSPTNFKFEIQKFNPPVLNNKSNLKINTSADTGKKYSSQSTNYAYLSKSEALKAAQANDKLEKLTSQGRITISESDFKNDIPYAGAGTMNVLQKAANQIGENLTITSALGTAASPHVKSSGYESHYNSDNPKLDIGGGLSTAKANDLRTKLLSTGYFSRVEVEKHKDGSNTAHLDVQIKPSELQKLNISA